MAARAGRHLVAAAACLIVLQGCETSTKLGDLLQPKAAGELPSPPVDATGSVSPPASDFQPDAVPKGLLGKDPNDDLSLGKKYFRAADFGLASGISAAL